MTAPQPTRQRSTPKRPRPGTAYDQATRDQALALLRDHGLAEAHRQLGIAKPTLSRWAKAAGIDTAGLHRDRVDAAVEARREIGARTALTTSQMLEAHLAEAGAYLLEILKVNAEAARLIGALDPDNIKVEVGMAGPYAVVLDADAAAAQKKALALATLPLTVRDAVGLHTRTIHDIALINGEATERGELVVQFAIPRPRPSDIVITQLEEPAAVEG